MMQAIKGSKLVTKWAHYFEKKEENNETEELIKLPHQPMLLPPLNSYQHFWIGFMEEKKRDRQEKETCEDNRREGLQVNDPDH